MPLGAKPWHYAAELRTLSVTDTYPFCGSALTDTTDILSEMCPVKLTVFCLFLYSLLPVFVPSILHNLTRPAYSLTDFQKLLRPGLEPATPR